MHGFCSPSPIPTPLLRHESFLWRCFTVLVKCSSFATSLEPPGSPKRSAGFTFETAPEGTRKREIPQEKELLVHESCCCGSAWGKLGQSSVPSYSRSSNPTTDRPDEWGEKSLPERHKHHSLMVQLSISVKEIRAFDFEAFLQVTGTQHWPGSVFRADEVRQVCMQTVGMSWLRKPSGGQGMSTSAASGQAVPPSPSPARTWPAPLQVPACTCCHTGHLSITAPALRGTPACLKTQPGSCRTTTSLRGSIPTTHPEEWPLKAFTRHLGKEKPLFNPQGQAELSHGTMPLR